MTSGSVYVLLWFDIQSNTIFTYILILSFVSALRLPFRLLVKEFGVGISYTPMILADSFIYSNLARDMEFQVCKGKQYLFIS